MVEDNNNIQKMPFIGKQVRVISAKNKSYNDVEGKIVDETKFSFSIKSATKTKVVLKQGTIFDIDGVSITGDTIIGRCDQRIRN